MALGNNLGEKDREAHLFQERMDFGLWCELEREHDQQTYYFS